MVEVSRCLLTRNWWSFVCIPNACSPSQCPDPVDDDDDDDDIDDGGDNDDNGCSSCCHGNDKLLRILLTIELF